MFNRILSGLLVILGFSACHSDDEIEPCEYGSPTVDYHIMGRVTDASGAPIKGIRVTVKGVEPYTDALPPELAKKAVVFTDNNGSYCTEDISTGGIGTRLRVVMEDVDGPDNGGEFAKDSVKVTEMERKQVRKRSNWYLGEFELKADKMLKKNHSH